MGHADGSEGVRTGWAWFDRWMARTFGLRLFVWWLAASVTTAVVAGLFVFLVFWEQLYGPAAQTGIALAVLFYTGNPAVQHLIGGSRREE